MAYDYSPVPNGMQYSDKMNSTIGILKASFGTKSRSKSRPSSTITKDGASAPNKTFEVIKSTDRTKNRNLVQEYSDSRLNLSNISRDNLQKGNKNNSSAIYSQSPFAQHLNFHNILHNSKENDLLNPNKITNDERRDQMKSYTKKKTIEFENLELRKRAEYEDHAQNDDMNFSLQRRLDNLSYANV